MNNIKSDFTIKDLENLTGIKAHTIRIWEKRYQLLQPQRTSGNIRHYDTLSLQKLLNIVLLNNHGYKISKIANLSEESIILIARELANESAINDEAINALKMAMFNFNTTLFNTTYNQLLLKRTFREVFKEVFIPFLNHIGLLWQTNTLTPAHEHFISNLIAQKIQINTEKLQQNPPTDSSLTYLLYLPENEIHELGLMYLNYELSLRGFHVIYLGQSIPISNLNFLLNKFESVCLISSFTVVPSVDKLDDYLKKTEDLLKNTNHQFWVFGSRVSCVDKEKYAFTFFDGLLDVLKQI